VHCMYCIVCTYVECTCCRQLQVCSHMRAPFVSFRFVSGHRARNPSHPRRRGLSRRLRLVERSGYLAACGGAVPVPPPPESRAERGPAAGRPWTESLPIESLRLRCVPADRRTVVLALPCLDSPPLTRPMYVCTLCSPCLSVRRERGDRSSAPSGRCTCRPERLVGGLVGEWLAQ